MAAGTSGEYDFDLFTIGAGSGGVRASRVAAAHGAKVAVAEEHRVGGTCVIRGCVPKKMLVYGAHFAEDLKDARNFGWSTENATFDWITLRDNVLKDVERIEGAYTNTLESHEVTIFKERAEITGPHEITLASGKVVTAKTILIATGARPRMPECQGAEHAISSNEAFHLDELPKKIIIAGGGYIANEFAGIFNEFGSEVHIVNRGDRLLRSYDEAVRDRLLQISTMKGIKFRFNTTFEYIKPCDEGGYFVKMSDCDEEKADLVMFAVGRLPNTEGLGLDKAGV
ncbi:MAG: FAD-dependent oxidoreductase, partial [Pseudomonadota bacterium]|nr:FAD-dependent oxidoreductase [Pseudomonadota bacterium]